MASWLRSIPLLVPALVSGPLAPALSVAAGPQDPPAGAVPTGQTVPGTPFTITRSQSVADALVLNWDRSCRATDTDYQVYEGALGSFTSHAPVLCSTGGATIVTIAATPGNHYYFIVPQNGANEGSYGTTSTGSERPLGVASCRAKSVASCQTQSACGDGTVDPGESCDDGNVFSGDGCSASCGVEPGYTCAGQPSVCTPQPACGDGTIDAGESCDDGNIFSGDGCSASCGVEPGYTCAGQPSVCTPQPACGDGTIDPGETCDDGNDFSGDGCSASCGVEPGYTCAGQPSMCTPL